MPARYRQFRALDDQFRSLLDQREAWPSYKAILHAAKPKGGKKEDIALLKAGEAVPQKFVIALAELLRSTPVMAEFFAQRGGEGPMGLSIEQIADRIAGPLQPQREAIGDDDDDWLMKGREGLVKLFTDFVWRDLTPPRSRCESEADVRTAVDMILATAGRHAMGRMDLPDDEAFQSAERHMRISRDDYLGRAIDLWRAEKWVFTFGVVNRQRVGCCCVLPLQENAYEAIRRGERTTHSCTADDIAVPSQMLFLEALGLAHIDAYPQISKKTSHTGQAIYVQLAALSLGKVPDLPPRRRQPLRILSMAANASNAKRLRRFGFVPTGTKMAGFDIPILELDQRKGWFIPTVIAMLQTRLVDSNKAFKHLRSEWES